MNQLQPTASAKREPIQRIDWSAFDDNAAKSLFEEKSDSKLSRYALLRSALPVDPNEVERSDARVVEVHVFWKGELMNVAHVRGPAPYGLGALPGEVEPGAARLEFSRDHAAVVLAEGARARVISKSAGSAAVTNSGWVGLDDVQRVEVEIGALAYRVALTRAGKPSPRALGGRSDRYVPLFFGAAALSSGAMMAALALYVPPIGILDDEQRDPRRVYVLQQYLNASAERERELELDTPDAPSDGGAAEVAAKGPEGALGRPEPSEKKGRLAIAADRESPSPSMTRESILETARNFGVIGLLSGSDSAVPSSPFAELAAGAESENAVGDLWSDRIGEGIGSGLALSGIGVGGGYIGDKIGLDRIGTCQDGACTGNGTFGHFAARTGGSHVAKVPVLRTTEVAVSGRLPPDVIQRVVRQNFGRFRFCYEAGLRENPNLEGRVTARFVIGRDGSVATVQSGGSDLPNSEVVGCVLRAYQGLSFPAPEEGIVTVSYPISFAPAG